MPCRASESYIRIVVSKCPTDIAYILAPREMLPSSFAGCWVVYWTLLLAEWIMHSSGEPSRM